MAKGIDAIRTASCALAPASKAMYICVAPITCDTRSATVQGPQVAHPYWSAATEQGLRLKLSLARPSNSIRKAVTARHDAMAIRHRAKAHEVWIISTEASQAAPIS